MKNKNANAKCVLQLRDEFDCISKISSEGDTVDCVVSAVLRMLEGCRQCEVLAGIVIGVLEVEGESSVKGRDEALHVFLNAAVSMQDFWIEHDRRRDAFITGESPKFE